LSVCDAYGCGDHPSNLELLFYVLLFLYDEPFLLLFSVPLVILKPMNFYVYIKDLLNVPQ